MAGGWSGCAILAAADPGSCSRIDPTTFSPDPPLLDGVGTPGTVRRQTATRPWGAGDRRSSSDGPATAAGERPDSRDAHRGGCRRRTRLCSAALRMRVVGPYTTRSGAPHRAEESTT